MARPEDFQFFRKSGGLVQSERADNFCCSKFVFHRKVYAFVLKKQKGEGGSKTGIGIRQVYDFRLRNCELKTPQCFLYKNLGDLDECQAKGAFFPEIRYFLKMSPSLNFRCF